MPCLKSRSRIVCDRFWSNFLARGCQIYFPGSSYKQPEIWQWIFMSGNGSRWKTSMQITCPYSKGVCWSFIFPYSFVGQSFYYLDLCRKSFFSQQVYIAELWLSSSFCRQNRHPEASSLLSNAYCDIQDFQGWTATGFSIILGISTLLQK